MRILPEPLEFEWDKWNTDKNWLKHKVSNQEAEDVFITNRFLLLKDKVHSVLEHRYLVIGLNSHERVLVLAITIRNKKVRIISARPASKKERQFYEKTFEGPQI